MHEVQTVGLSQVLHTSGHTISLASKPSLDIKISGANKVEKIKIKFFIFYLINKIII
jgi:hypothetical protein